ncbi:unnamed protein product [Didymodactylos carnosus]|uniref:Alpha-1,4 glucan phosphorylase n=1 Tax=Didymodactylos carnosus TaxID=1234261 RepID=A0A814HN22_9BILA|nr:unnamed protein product [Didymodactylos carnosus]CAF3783814.1 unnamed protein product [Didymodactylos carnosus]
MNGALTVCTINASTIDLAKEIGESNMFIFGMKKEEDSCNNKCSYVRQPIVENNSDLQEAILQIKNGFYSNNCTELCKYLIILRQPYIYSKREIRLTYMILADYESYVQTQENVSKLFKNPIEWVKKVILNISTCTKFSIDFIVLHQANELYNL